MSDNPFDQSGDGERTVIRRPTPGGRPAAPPPAFDSPAYDPPPGVVPAAGPVADPVPISSGELPALTMVGASPLMGAAAPLLQLLGRLRNTQRQPDPAELRLRALQAMRNFESSCRAANVPQEMLAPARYALCAAIDDVVMNTPWGRASSWVQASLVSTLHREVISGEGFFYQLDALKREPARNLDILELMYVCLSLGYQGQYRVDPQGQGPAKLDRLREDLYTTIRQLRAAYDPALSPHWRGETAPYKAARAVVPVWVMAVVALACVAAAWLGFRGGLSNGAEAAYELARAMPPTGLPKLDRPPPPPPPPAPVVPVVRVAPPAPPPPPLPPPVSSIRRFLQPEIERRLVQVDETPQAITVRIFSAGMFPLGSATVQRDLTPLLERIGQALNDEPGWVLVTGHTDNLPIRDLVFRSNLRLSQARAQAAAAVIARTLKDQERLRIEGRADEQPVAPNETEEGRAQNRRIDIIVQRRG